MSIWWDQYIFLKKGYCKRRKHFISVWLMKLHQSQSSTIKFHIYPSHPSDCWSSVFRQYFRYKPKLRVLGKLKELESLIKINVSYRNIGVLNKYKNTKNQRAVRARKEDWTLAGWGYCISQEIIYSCFFPIACGVRDVILLNLKLTIALERLGVPHSVFAGRNYLQTNKWILKEITCINGVPLP